MEITIDLSSTLTIGVITGLILMFITAAWNFAKLLFAKQIIEKKFFGLFSEVESLHKKYKDEITDINKSHIVEKEKAIEEALDIYSKKFTEMLNEYKQIEHLPPHGGVNWLRELYFYGNSSKTKKNS